MPSPSEFDTHRPQVFQRPDLDSLVYIETRRAPGSQDPLSGNLGVSPMILGEENYARTSSPLTYSNWRSQEFAKVEDRLKYLKDTTGLEEIGAPRLPHGTDLINLDVRLDGVSIDTPFEKRASADASTSSHDGVGILKAVGDCAPVSIVYPEAARIALVHVGIRGAAKEIIPKTLARLEKLGHDPSDASVYVGPHAHQFQTNRAEFDELNEIIAAGSSEVKREYLMSTEIGPTGYPIIDLSRLVFWQLERSGVLPAEIQMSQVDTLSSNRHFSNYTTVTKGVPDGRFGVLLGKSTKPRA